MLFHSAALNKFLCMFGKQPISKLQNEENSGGFVCFLVVRTCFFFPLPNLKPHGAKPSAHEGHSNPCWHPSNPLFRAAHCGSTQPQTALYVFRRSTFIRTCFSSSMHLHQKEHRTKVCWLWWGKADEADCRVTLCKFEVSLRNSLCWHIALGEAGVNHM